MLKLGNVRILLSGSIVIPPQYHRALFSIAGLFSVLLLEVPFFVISYQKSVGLFAAFLALSIAFFLLASIMLSMTAFTDPGIVPGREFYDLQISHLKNLIAEKQRAFYYYQAARPKYTLSLNVKAAQFYGVPENQTASYKALNSNHSPMTPLRFSLLDYQFTAKYCQTCRFYRPLRATHGSKSNCCIQRYDHYCAWIGGDVGLHNLGSFYLMLGALLLDLGFSLVFAAVSIVFCGVNYRVSAAAFGLALVFGIAQIGGSGYLLFSVGQLVAYHVYLLRTGSLTKEDSGAENANVAGPFSYFDTLKNARLGMQGARQQHILKKVIAGHAYIVSLVLHNPYVTSFDSLGRILGMQGYQQFAYSRPDQLEAQTVNNKLRYENIFTARDGAEYAIIRGKQMVITSRKTIDQLRVTRPQLFQLSNSADLKNLALVKCCGRSQTAAKLSPPGPTNRPTEGQIYAAGI